MSKTKIEKIFPEYIRLDGGTQPRAKINQQVCDDYGEGMKAGEKFPPIDVFFDGENSWLADGFHRLQAYVMALPGEAIECNVYQGSLQDAQWHSCGANKTHGVRRSNEDKDRAVQMALIHPESEGKSTRQIAEHCGVSEAMVRLHRNKLTAHGAQSGVREKATAHGAQSGDREKATAHGAQSGCSAPSCEAASRPRTGRDGRTINTAKIGRNGRKGQSDKPSRRMVSRIQNPTLVPPPLQKMTSLCMPHNPLMGARTLIEVFDADYLRAVVDEISRYLKGLQE